MPEPTNSRQPQEEYPDLLESFDDLTKSLVDDGHEDLALQAREIRDNFPVAIENARIVVGLHAEIVRDAYERLRMVNRQCHHKLEEVRATVERALSQELLVQAAHQRARHILQDADTRASQIIHDAKQSTGDHTDKYDSDDSGEAND